MVTSDPFYFEFQFMNTVGLQRRNGSYLIILPCRQCVEKKDKSKGGGGAEVNAKKQSFLFKEKNRAVQCTTVQCNCT